MSRSPIVRFFMLLCACLCLLMGIIGIIVPGLPTTVFILLAAWFASRGSPRLLAWLERHELFGPMISNWRAGGFVSRRAKWSATVMMALCAVILAWTSDHVLPFALVSAIMLSVLVWLWLRPEPPAGVPDAAEATSAQGTHPPLPADARAAAAVTAATDDGTPRSSHP